MKKRWQIEDFIDLEYFFYLDDRPSVDPNQLLERDRDIYLDRIRSLKNKGLLTDRKDIILAWLEQRRQNKGSDDTAKAALPGAIFSEIFSIFKYLMIGCGILAGAGLALPFLNYKGIEPLNVSSYMLGLIGVQILLLVILFTGMAIRTRHGKFTRHSLIYGLLKRMMIKSMIWLKQYLDRNLKKSQVDGASVNMALFTKWQRLYGSLFFLPIFILTQLFGVFFNIGVLGATLFKVLGSDMAFGWQSTVQVSSHFVHKAVTLIALPWSWFLPAQIAHPTLAQIQGSRIILKDGIYHLTTPDLVSWWPFLCMAVLFYGFLPRLTLLVTGQTIQNAIIKRIKLDHGVCDKLLERLQTPVLDTRAGLAQNPILNEQITATLMEEIEPKLLQAKDLIIFIPDEIIDDCSKPELETIIHKQGNSHLRKVVKIGEDLVADQKVIEKISQLNWTDGKYKILILCEAWQPPIAEFLTFIRDLRNATHQSMLIEIGLIGRPTATTIFTPVKPDDWKAWYHRIQKLADPYLNVTRLVMDGETV